MSSVSLISHPSRYSLTTAEVFLCSVTATAIPYALRHFQQARSSEKAAWKHYCIGVIECFPVLGLIVAIIEHIINRRNFLVTLTQQLIDRLGPSHFTFQAQDCVTEFERLPPPEQTRLQKATTQLLNNSVAKIEKTQRHSCIHDLMENLSDLSEKTIITSTPTPQSFINALQDLAPPGVTWHQTYYFGETALHWAVRSTRIDVIKYLLNIPEGRAMLNLGDKIPLMLATATKDISLDTDREEIVSLLLEAEANPNLINREGFTPLYAAAENGSLSLIRIFLQHPTVTINPTSPLSDNASKALYYSYYQIEKTLKEGLEIVIAHTDLHRLVINYYFTRESTLI